MRILLICSGNTCRSPLAAALLRSKLDADPELAGIEVSSAGTGAWDGAPASEGSYLIALERGLDLSGHRARMLTVEMVRQADLLLTMNEAQAQRVADLGGGTKVHSLISYAGTPDARREVRDPFGGDVELYRETGEHLDGLLDRVTERLRAELKR